MKSLVTTPFLTLCTVAISGCSTTQGTQENKVLTITLPDQWEEAVYNGKDTRISDDFFSSLSDETLQSLLMASDQTNRTLAVARENIAISESNLTISNSGQVPSVNVSGAAQRDRLTTESTGNFSNISNSYSTSGLISWEVDIWGRNQIRETIGDAGVVTAKADFEVTRLALRINIARTYIQYRQSQHEVELIQDSINLLEERLVLTKLLFAQGLAADVEVQQIIAQISGFELSKQQAETRATLFIYQLAPLIGTVPADAGRRLSGKTGLPDFLGSVPDILPSSVLDRRPDLKAARARIMTADANYSLVALNGRPSFSLSGDAGVLSATLDQLLTGAAYRNAISAALSWPIFNGGRLKAEREIADSALRQSILAYEDTILIALSETEQSLLSYYDAKIQIEIAKDRLQTQSKVRDLTALRVEQGLESSFFILDAETELLNRKQDLLVAQSNELLSLVDFYAATGGNWDKI